MVLTSIAIAFLPISRDRCHSASVIALLHRGAEAQYATTNLDVGALLGGSSRCVRRHIIKGERHLALFFRSADVISKLRLTPISPPLRRISARALERTEASGNLRTQKGLQLLLRSD